MPSLPGRRSALAAPLTAAVLPATSGRAEARALTLGAPGATRHGHQVTFTGRLAPAEQGVRVGVYLGSSVVAWAETNENGFFVARPNLFTTGGYRARAPGAVSAAHHVRIVRPLLRVEVDGASVRRLVRSLNRLGYAVRSRSATEFDGAVRQSVYAFQKAQGLRRDGIVGRRTKARLRDPHAVNSRLDGPRHHLEVDKERQLLLVVEAGDAVRIVNASAARGAAGDALTGRKLDVLQLAARGLSNSEIAKELFVSATTVKAHLAHIYRKLGVNDRTAAVTTALEHQIIRLEDA